jgi:DNA replication protein DnaC
VRLISVPGFLDRLRSRIRFADSPDPLPELVEADLVVLDDLGREKVTDWASERLYVLVNERYNAMRPTVVTSNYGPDQLAERGYDALVSRLVEGSPAIQITASDYRSGAA